MVEKAVKYFKGKGAEKAFAEFNNPKGSFVEGELHVFAYDMNGKNVAHGANPAHIGKDLINLTDANGKLIIKEMIDLAKSKGSGWIDYKYKNPKTGEIEPKSSFIKRWAIISSAAAFTKKDR